MSDGKVQLTTRELGESPKGLSLTNAEIDQNFLNIKEAVEVDVPQQIERGSLMAAIIFN